MDQFLLQAVVTEAAGRLVEREILRVASLGRHHYLLRFATPSRDNLLVSARPDLPRLHLLSAVRVKEDASDRFAAWLDQELAGGVLTALETRPWDRVVVMRFRLPRHADEVVERRLIFEMPGRSANLLLLDGRDIVLGFARDLGGDPRAPRAGDPYSPPPGREELASIPVDPSALDLIRASAGGARDFLTRVSPLFARDLRAAGADDRTTETRIRELLEAASSGAWSPVVYSARPLADFTEGDAPGRDDLVVSPLPLLAPGGGGEGPARRPVETRYESPSAATEACLGLVERLRDFRDQRDHHGALVRREIERLRTLCGRLEEELGRARASDGHRRLGEALLAGLAAAEIRGGAALVPDPYDSTGPRLSIPIDPALPLPENARILFERYKKGKRGVPAIERRLEAARTRLLEWSGMAGRADAARAAADLERLREDMARLGLVHAAPARRSAGAPRRKEEPARVRRYTSPDGLLILVGRSGEENDTLTFRVASPWDFWLHAAERPGAHVVVRNPGRLKSLPERTLRLAADIAAFHSGARKEARVDVHYTQRKHVHKRKGAPSGQVLLRRFRTLQATPRLPTLSIEDV